MFIKIVGRYNSTCEIDQDCLKNGECRSNHDTPEVKYCQCSSKERSLYRSDYTPYRQCRLLVGAKCDGKLHHFYNWLTKV